MTIKCKRPPNDTRIDCESKAAHLLDDPLLEFGDLMTNARRGDGAIFCLDQVFSWNAQRNPSILAAAASVGERAMRKKTTFGDHDAATDSASLQPFVVVWSAPSVVESSPAFVPATCESPGNTSGALTGPGADGQ